jgi:hypothetical protein
VLDVAVESLALTAIERGRKGPIGPEPVIAYVLARQVEVSLLRVLLLGQLAGTDPETLRTRVQAQALRPWRNQRFQQQLHPDVFGGRLDGRTDRRLSRRAQFH